MEKHVIIPAVCLLLEREGTWFVGRRQNTGYCDGCLNMPVGHIDPDETPREAAVREANEEVGVLSLPMILSLFTYSTTAMLKVDTIGRTTISKSIVIIKNPLTWSLRNVVK